VERLEILLLLSLDAKLDNFGTYATQFSFEYNICHLYQIPSVNRDNDQVESRIQARLISEFVITFVM
jgi:hypothetical protein